MHASMFKDNACAHEGSYQCLQAWSLTVRTVCSFICLFLHPSQSADQVRCSRHPMAAIQPALSWNSSTMGMKALQTAGFPDIIHPTVCAVLQFEGGVVVISHDSQLLSRVCDDAERSEVWLVEDGEVERYDGYFEEYKAELVKEIADEMDED